MSSTILEIAGDFEAESIDGRSPFESVLFNVSRNVTRVTEQAVLGWANQCNMTPRQWLEFYEAHTRIVPDGDNNVRIVVEPSVRGELPNLGMAALVRRPER